MLTVEEIQQAIVSLSSEDRGRLHDWMIECEDAWDDIDRLLRTQGRENSTFWPLKRWKQRRRAC